MKMCYKFHQNFTINEEFDFIEGAGRANSVEGGGVGQGDPHS